jgi:2-dehydro-3-deoxygluconokinase
MVFDLIGLGSALVDFIPAIVGTPLSKAGKYLCRPGGAVSNIVVGASRLGLKTGFIGSVGDDEFGTFIIHNFKREGVDISHIKRIKERSTGIAFHEVDTNGESHYIFYRFPGYSDPESIFKPSDIIDEYLKQSKLFHFSESLLRKKNIRTTVINILKKAKENKLAICFDPNIRKNLWLNNQDLIDTYKEVLSLTDVFMSTRKEAQIIVGEKLARNIANKILNLGPSIAVVREKESYQVATCEEQFRIPVFKVKAIDTSGAGDTFDAGFLTGLCKGWSLRNAVLLGGAVASIRVTKKNTRNGLPQMNEALQFLRKKGKNLKYLNNSQ